MDIPFLSSKKCVGVDIGSKNIKVVFLKQSSKKQFHLDYWRIANLPDNIVSLDTIPESRNPVVIETLKEIFSKKKSLPKTVGICVSGTSVVIRYIKLPIMTREELSKSISIEVEPFIPFPVNEVYLSFDVVGEVMEEGVRKNEVVIVAAKKDYIDSQIDILQQCNLIPKYIDVDIFALEKVLRYNYEIENDIVCVVNIGANITNVGIVENGTTRVCRDLPLGMGYILNEIKKNRQMEFQEIMNYIKKDGLIISDEAKEKYFAQSKKTELAISKDLSSLLKEFTTELHKIIDFYYFQKGEQKPLSKIFISGGGSVIKNICEYFTTEFKIQTELLDPLKNVQNADIVPYETRPLLSVAIGLGMKSYL
ncbi:MAG: type IV pilus assembly protein PilM [Endomicrobia bacterium]|nr:type IV pilus assembly protein PilM [Endomicrobiia bacterium]